MTAPNMGSATFDHPLRGTCVAGCPMFGQCHCGCGRKTTVATVKSTKYRLTRGRPRVWRSGHNPKPAEMLRHAAFAANMSRRAKFLPRERLYPLAAWLVARYGSLRHAAHVVGIPTTTLGQIYWPKAGRARFTRETAQKLIEVVLAHRIPEASRSQFDVPRRISTPKERAEAEDVGRRERRQRNAGGQRRSRQQKKERAA